jgi:hypothetical protein
MVSFLLSIPLSFFSLLIIDYWLLIIDFFSISLSTTRTTTNKRLTQLACLLVYQICLLVKTKRLITIV